MLKRRDFDSASADLLTWRVHERAGLRVRASEIPLEQGTVVLMRLGVGALSFKIPCRVVDLIDEPGRRGFVYGTLPGHPEAGEEQFLLDSMPTAGSRSPSLPTPSPRHRWPSSAAPRAAPPSWS